MQMRTAWNNAWNTVLLWKWKYKEEETLLYSEKTTLCSSNSTQLELTKTPEGKQTQYHHQNQWSGKTVGTLGTANLRHFSCIPEWESKAEITVL